jgi:hypothetical protein
LDENSEAHTDLIINRVKRQRGDWEQEERNKENRITKQPENKVVVPTCSGLLFPNLGLKEDIIHLKRESKTKVYSRLKK